MKSKKNWTLLLVVVAVACLFALFAASACAPKPKPPKEVLADALEGAPDWVVKDCGAYLSKKGEKKICGVGSIGSTRNVSLAQTAAVERGRTAIARALEVKVKAMLKDYQATTTGGQEFGNAAADEQHVVDVAKQITDLNLSGTEPVETWVSNEGTLFVLVVLDVEKFKEVISKINSLSEGIRQAVIQRADKSFQELDQEISKERGGSQPPAPQPAPPAAPETAPANP